MFCDRRRKGEEREMRRVGEERKEDEKGKEEDTKNVVVCIEGGMFTWPHLPGKPALQDITTRLPKGECKVKEAIKV